MGADAYNTVFISFCSFFAYIGDIESELFHTALGVAHLGQVFIHVDASKYPTSPSLTDYDGILVVITLPGINATIRLRPSASSPF